MEIIQKSRIFFLFPFFFGSDERVEKSFSVLTTEWKNSWHIFIAFSINFHFFLWNFHENCRAEIVLTCNLYWCFVRDFGMFPWRQEALEVNFCCGVIDEWMLRGAFDVLLFNIFLNFFGDTILYNHTVLTKFKKKTNFLIRHWKELWIFYQ